MKTKLNNIVIKIKKGKSKLKLKRYLRLSRVSFTVFKGAFKSQMKQPDTLTTAAFMGFLPTVLGNKSTSKGVRDSFMIATFISGVSGVTNVVEHWDKLKKM